MKAILNSSNSDKNDDLRVTCAIESFINLIFLQRLPELEEMKKTLGYITLKVSELSISSIHKLIKSLFQNLESLDKEKYYSSY